ncbi:cyd operon protein YbgE [Pasteurella canis]|uniref:cyd operon protein YbgE n=1 Tax=Pasteurella canis TaxID=753 RepID=UPI001E57C544|nr:cyd operon protein YbgE [Pasteurella canis]UEA17057.1 cyd operon protein YbgE [Pasteurella canis]
MINSLYQIFNKGSFRTLSFILAILITLCFFLNIQDFSTNLRNAPAALVLCSIWGTVILWVHGMGFEMYSMLLRLVFAPLLGYIAVILAFYVSWLM